MNTLPKVIEEIILKYKYQLEHYDKYKKVLLDIQAINYNSNKLDNCCSFNIISGATLKSYHIKMCRDCGGYYRTNVIIYDSSSSISLRYSYYNSWTGDDYNVIENNYIVSYAGQDNLSWRNFYRNRTHNKHISCVCKRELYGMIGW